MTKEDENCVKVIVKTDPIIKRIELLNIGFLQKQSTFVNCPACEAKDLSVVREEKATCLQRFLAHTNWCKNWEGRCDINHYCSKCGCYIGRYVPINFMERRISGSARLKASRGQMILRGRPRDCAENMQKARERGKEKLAQEKAEAAARAEPTSVQEATAQ